MFNKIIKISLFIALAVIFSTTQAHTVSAVTCTDEWGTHAYDSVWRGNCSGKSGIRVWYTCLETGKRLEFEGNDSGCLQGVQPAQGITTSGIGDIFGKITAPNAIKNFAGGNPSGTVGISTFLNNLISLIYIFASIALIFMLLWGAFDWITSEGDKEKVKSAQNKIINAFVGIILFAVAFAVLSVVGTFTGFRFFEPQSDSQCPERTDYYLENGICIYRYDTYDRNLGRCVPHHPPVDSSYCK